MNKGWIVAIVVVIAVLAIPGCSWVVTHNRIVSYHEQIDGAFAQVETVLQRRYDLIPNLVNTVKGYAQHEREVLEDITKYRSSCRRTTRI